MIAERSFKEHSARRQLINVRRLGLPIAKATDRRFQIIHTNEQYVWMTSRANRSHGIQKYKEGEQLLHEKHPQRRGKNDPGLLLYPDKTYTGSCNQSKIQLSINRVVPSLTAMIATELEVKVIECDCPFFFPSDPISGQSSTEVTIAEPLTCSSSMFMGKCLPATMLC